MTRVREREKIYKKKLYIAKLLDEYIKININLVLSLIIFLSQCRNVTTHTYTHITHEKRSLTFCANKQ